MKPYECKRFYHPRLGIFVFQHKGSGIIVNNIWKPVKSIMSSVFKKVGKPLGKRALESAISHSGDKIGKTIVEKSGDLIMKKFSEMRKSKNKMITRPQQAVDMSKQNESTDMILNRLISGDGIKRRRK